ncbi:MAG: hypothetical protein IAE89_05860 [Anaerolineae bacterium]|nr:hypothetical protein [Anaerolineae bacterium]
MFDRYLAQLKSADPAQRRQAIISLGKLGNFAAMPLLAEVYRTDPDPELRDLARHAGLAIRQRNPGMSGTAVPPPTSPPPSASSPAFTVSLDDVPESAMDPYRANESIEEPDLDLLIGQVTAAAGIAGASKRGIEALDKPSAPRTAADDIEDELRQQGPVAGREYNVPKEERERAKAAIESALTLQMRGENGKSLKLLTEALSFDPNLINDSYFTSIAASVTGLDGNGALRVIIDKGQRRSFVKNAEQTRKQQRNEKHLTEVRQNDWNAVVFELFIYFLIMLFGPIFLVLVIGQSLGGLFGNFTGNADFMASLPPEIANFTAIAAAPLLLMGLFSAVGSVIALFIQGGLIHLISTGVLGGRGTFPNMLTLILRVYNRWVPIIYLLGYVTIAVLFIAQGSIVVLCLALPMIVISFYMVLQVVVRTGSAYDYGTAMGCIAIILSNFVLTLISTLLGVLAGQTLSQALIAALGLN